MNAHGSEPRVLVIDDDPEVLDITSEILKRHGYDIYLAADGQAGMAMFEKDRPTIVLTDIQMPNMTGMQILKAVKQMSPVTQVVVMSGVGTTEDVIEALRQGASDYLIKPLNVGILTHTISRCSERYDLIRERIGREAVLARKVKERTAALTKTFHATVKAFGLMTEKRDSYTAGHQHRVAVLANGIGKRLGVGRQRLEVIHVAGLLHDIGKVAVPVELLVKPSTLSAAEEQLMRTHPQAGYDIIKDIPFAESLGQDVSVIVLQHHERLDGSGYPVGLTDRQMTMESKILSVSDVVEAMSSHRPYRAALSMNETKAEITYGRGRLYDADCVDACLQMIEENRDDIDRLFQRLADEFD